MGAMGTDKLTTLTSEPTMVLLIGYYVHVCVVGSVMPCNYSDKKEVDHKSPAAESWHKAATAAITAPVPAEGISPANSEGGECEGLP